MNKILTKNVFLLIVTFFLLQSCSSSPVVEGDIDIVPFPKEVKVTGKTVSFDVSKIGIVSDEVTAGLCNVIRDDLYRLAGIASKKNGKPVIHLSVDKNLAEDNYQVKIDAAKITITGGSYSAVSFGWVSVLQTAVFDRTKMKVPGMEINDCPDLKYRGFMLDLARKFHTHHAVKQMIDVCRWYRIGHLQLHLSDDQLYVFPSAKYPKLMREGAFYTPEQIREIVNYADERGIVLVPELEGPGHSSILRRAYPEVFGKPEYRCIDISDDKALDAMKTLTGEVIDAFPSSPLFHIGADESELNGLQALPHVAAKIKEKGYKDVYDLYLNYLCEMHSFVKSKGRQTCLWEGFDKDGSESVKISKDVLVFEFETLYQRPDSLAKNGYRMVNTSWEPIYVTIEKRWSPKDIFDWNYYTWKNWWEKAPAFKAPIVLDKEVRHLVYGAQMCSWGMPEEAEYPSVCKRLAAMSEKIWNTGTDDYESFSKRIVNSEAKLRKLLYPFTVTATGLTEPDYEGNDYNRENFFAQQLTLSVKSHLPETVIRYTSDGSFPTTTAAVFPESLVINKSTFIKIGVYDSEGKLLSYYPVFYKK